MRVCGIIWRCARGGCSWVSSRHGFLPDWPYLACRCTFICCGNTARSRVPFSSLMFFERRTQSSIKHRRSEVSAAVCAALPVRGASRAGFCASVYAFDGDCPGERRPHHGVRDRQFVQHAPGRPVCRREESRPRSDQCHARERSRAGDYLRRPGQAADRHDAGQAVPARGA